MKNLTIIWLLLALVMSGCQEKPRGDTSNSVALSTEELELAIEESNREIEKLLVSFREMYAELNDLNCSKTTIDKVTGYFDGFKSWEIFGVTQTYFNQRIKCYNQFFDNIEAGGQMDKIDELIEKYPSYFSNQQLKLMKTIITNSNVFEMVKSTTVKSFAELGKIVGNDIEELENQTKISVAELEKRKLKSKLKYYSYVYAKLDKLDCSKETVDEVVATFKDFKDWDHFEDIKYRADKKVHFNQRIIFFYQFFNNIREGGRMGKITELLSTYPSYFSYEQQRLMEIAVTNPTVFKEIQSSDIKSFKDLEKFEKKKRELQEATLDAAKKKEALKKELEPFRNAYAKLNDLSCTRQTVEQVATKFQNFNKWTEFGVKKEFFNQRIKCYHQFFDNMKPGGQMDKIEELVKKYPSYFSKQQFNLMKKTLENSKVFNLLIEKERKSFNDVKNIKGLK
ncbi:hypothetical protein ACI760_03005 [Capnocytophaga canimorsus]|uniref:hypothetical protein n=1 Tax=Capnocytophaga canimorsus TaxID=28188 RepID=UPI00385A4E0D